ncbi:autotransporter-associated N-terminal domain-containing protein [Fusobacterium periodonticum]|uniref:Autotransporter domain-containing protein n=3 Tax=Fusobacterium periodonticum TaxID=860 RepID=A0AAD0HWI1_9FUSO|nr:autotransporter-associated N-terminal domain-containing protein [Fusobacterium periodonticum]AVQ26336.1 autotransporter domain-containing protein [Fusobacterium periodonticum]
MGNNSLSNTEKSLRSIAKRYENVKYSVSLAVLFLMNGASAFSDTNAIQETDKQKEVAKDSQAGKTVVKETKAEKKQTSQKLKASWVNMQFGANDMYSNYFAVPKAKVEKTSLVTSEKTVLVASADNTASLPMFAKLLTDIEETTENRTEVLTTIAKKEETPTMEEIKASKQELRSSVGNLQDKIDTARRENQKEIDGLKLELVQLMEQGDQVVKSPWSSWQFGANYFYEDWGGSYKGRGDKAKEKLDLTKKTDPLERFKASSQMSSTYGTTSLDLVYEPPREVEVSAGIRPKEVNKRAPGFVPPEPSGSLPPFEPKIIQPPKAPEVTPPRIDEPAVISYPGFGSSIQNYYSFWNGSPGATGNSSTMMDQIALTAGKFKVTSNEGAYIKGYQGVGGYKATSTTVEREVPTGSIPADGYHALARRFFFGIRNSAFIQWEPEVEISWFNKGTNNNQLIYMETSNISQQNLETLNAGGAFANSPGLYDAVKAYKTQTALRDDGDGATGINLHNNKGTIYLGGNNTRYQATTTIGGTRLSVFNNEGTIVGMNVHEGNTGENGSTKQVVYFNTPDTSSDQRWIYANGTNGKINLYGSESIAMYYTSSSGSQQQYVKTGFVNEGLINLYGRNSSGVMVRDSETLKAGSGFYLNKPVNIYADGARGVYIAGNISNMQSANAIVRANIGFDKNDTTGFDWTDIEDGTTKHFDSNGNITGKSTDFVDNAVGVMYTHANTNTKIQTPDITMEKFSKESLGVYVSNGKLTVESGTDRSKININGGEGNVALYAKGGEIEYNGDITMGTSSLVTEGGNSSGKGNIGIVAENGHKVTLNGLLKTYNGNGSTRDGIGVYADNSDVSVTQAVDMKFVAGTTGENVGIYSKGPGTGVAGKTVTILGNGSKINIDGGTTGKGTALYSGAGGKIIADSTATTGGLQVTVTNGAAAIASDGTNSNVSAKFSNIDYSGEGYALYTSNGGKIDVTGSKISLRGNATGFERDVASATSPITFKDITGSNAATITAYSNNVTIMNLRNVPTLNLSTLNTNLQTYTGGVTHLAGTDPVTGEVYNKYKTAAVDGLSAYNIDTDLDKSVATDDANAATNDYVFTRRMAVQRGIINLKAGKNVKAILSTTDLSKIGETSVVGLSMNSSSYATSNAEAGINLEANTTVTADRTTAGNGAVGLYINYGKINTDASSIINVEKETSNPANDSAVGIYSVNGSEVTNAGQVNVGGQNSIGILGLAYRIDSATNNPILNEFGATALGQGKATVLNKGQVSLDGANATGIYIKNNNASATRATAVGTNDTTGVITLTGDSSTGMSGDKATLENKGTININGQKSVGMFAKNSSELINSGTINLAAGLSENEPNIGIYAKDADTTVTNSKDIIGGNNTYGIYGKTVSLTGTGKIELGDASVGIFSDAEYTSTPTVATIDLANGSKLKVGAKESVGVFATGKNQNISSKGDIEVGDTSFAFVVRGTGTTLKTDNTNGVTLGNDATFIYSNDTTGNIENKTALTATGSKNYGIYAAGTATNLADMNFGTGVGNVGMYSIGGGTVTNGSATVSPTITVSASDVVNKLYGIGMAAGYVNDAGTLVSTGNVVNYGTIKVEKDNGIGMFATGSGSTATNRGTIELSGKKTTGMYLDNNAIGYNYGTITTVPNPSNDGIVGVVASNGAIIKNYGTINIVDGSNLTGVFINKGTEAANYDNQIPGGGTGVLNGKIEVKKQSATGKTVAGIDIKAPGDGTATIYRDGAQVTPIAVDTVTATPQPLSVNVGTTSLDLSATDLATPSLGQASSIGMYVDTSGVNYTNPIQGLNLLTGLQKVDLIFGTEASKYTNEKDIEVGQNILKPYNDVITSLSGGTSMKFSFTSGSLTWIATATQNTDDTLKALYLSKIPYTAFAKDKNTGNFLAGLEQRYGVEGLGTREKALFDKLNGIGKGEAALFAQAVDQMKGHQYSNVQQRIQATGNILDREFDYLKGSWSNPTKDSNKIKTFGARGEYNTDTAGVEDYKNHAYGVAYVHEDETVRLGESTGWYAGVVENKLKFKDLGNSKEEQLQGKIGMFKSVPFDENNSLNWTISGDVFVGYNKMNRRFLVVDDIFGAKSRYYTYGLGVKNEISKSFRLSEGFSFTPHAGLNLEYGRFSKIREKSGEMRLEVKANDYFSIRPEVGADLAYKYSFGNNNLKVSVGVAYENELGKVANANNKARVAYTTADWYDLRGEKEDRRGNVKTDLNIGWDNQRVGVTANVGYDTKGENVRGGVGLRVIF